MPGSNRAFLYPIVLRKQLAPIAANYMRGIAQETGEHRRELFAGVGTNSLRVRVHNKLMFKKAATPK